MARTPRPLLIAASAALVTTALIGGAAVGQSRHDSSAPIDFDAQSIELDDRANRAILSGGVKITQANLTLNAARVTVSYSGQIIDGSPAALSWLGGVRGQAVRALGMERFGQSGDLPDLYATYRLDADAILDACADLLV